ncbi:MAG: DoxX family protein [Flavisolibacter sp.]|nr:DoxX family protein [Flavisolibacter sp.]MBD0351525.1 DoxX family protein [Flavisolibacter sp.]MBD0368942.1 DoxX family protein [Flavisolibacter sp.]MBD0377344.1 DoxX family protein [Flavisolibacter sp.]
MKKDKIVFWTATIIIFLFDTVMPALTSHTELAKQGIQHLGYPDYFRIQLTIFKVIGGMILILPTVSGRIKEWAYAGFGISFISAFIGHWVVDGIGIQTFFPLFILCILLVSYIYYHKLKAATLIEKEHSYLVKTSPF